MEDNINTAFLMKLIQFIDEQQEYIDGPYKVAMLKTAASYYESVTQAEALSLAISRAFNSIQ